MATPEEIELARQRYNGVDPPVAPSVPQEGGDVAAPPPPALSDASTSRAAQGLADVQAEQRASAIEQRGALATQEATEVAQARRAQGQALQTEAQAEDARAAAFDEDVQARIARFDELERKAAELEVVDRRTRGQKAMGAIAKAFAVAGDALTAFGGGRSNYLQTATETINALVQDDLDEQIRAKKDLRDQAGAELTQIGLVRNAFRDESAGRQYASGLRKEAYAADIEAISQRFEGTETQAKMLESAAAVRQDAAQDKANGLRQEEAQRRALAAQRARAAQKDTKIDYSAFTREQLEALRDAGRLPVAGEMVLKRLLAGEKPEPTTDRIPGGLVVTDREVFGQLDTVQKRKLADKAESVEKLLATLDEIDRIRAESTFTRGIPFTDANSQLEGLQGSLTGIVKEAESLGALDNGVLKLVSNTYGSATDFLDVSDMRRAVLRQSIVNDARKRFASEGVAVDPGGPNEQLIRATRSPNELKASFGFRPSNTAAR